MRFKRIFYCDIANNGRNVHIYIDDHSGIRNKLILPTVNFDFWNGRSDKNYVFESKRAVKS